MEYGSEIKNASFEERSKIKNHLRVLRAWKGLKVGQKVTIEEIEQRAKETGEYQTETRKDE